MARALRLQKATLGVSWRVAGGREGEAAPPSLAHMLPPFPSGPPGCQRSRLQTKASRFHPRKPPGLGCSACRASWPLRLGQGPGSGS